MGAESNGQVCLRVSPTLAVEIGLNESIVLMQLQYLTAISDIEQDGEKWIRSSLPQLLEKYFPFLSLSTLTRAIHELKKRDLIKIGNFNTYGYDRTQWFMVSLENCAKLNGFYIFHFDRMEPVKMNYPSSQNDRMLDKDLIKDLREEKKTKKAEFPQAKAGASSTGTEASDFPKGAAPAKREGQLTGASDEGKLFAAFGQASRTDIGALGGTAWESLAEQVSLLREKTGLKDADLAEVVIQFGDWYREQNKFRKNPNPYFRQIVQEWHKFEVWRQGRRSRADNAAPEDSAEIREQLRRRRERRAGERLRATA